MAIEGTVQGEVDTKDIISVMNRLNYLSEKSRVGTVGTGPQKGKEFKGGLTPAENDEFDKLAVISQKLLKSKDTRPVYSVKNPDGTTTLTYVNPTAKEEAAYRAQYGANTSLAQAGVSPYSGGKVLNWQQKQEALKRVEELRPKYASLSYAQQQEFDAIQRNLYASISVNADNPNPTGANATSISDNTPELLQQYGFDKSLTGVQVGAEPGSMPGTNEAVYVPNTMGTNQFSTPPTDLNSPEATEYNQYLKGRATQGLQTPSELQWTKNYNTNRYNILKGKATQGLKFTPQEQAESDFLINLGVRESTYNPSAATTPTGPTLASDVFKQTLAVFFGESEMNKSWVNELYRAVSKFYKQGATSEEAFNMAVLDSRNNPALTDFTKRFKGIYALQDMKQAGKAVTVPTIAEYFATESKMGDVLKQSNLNDLANEDFLGDVLAKGVSATEFANRITAIFDRIDNAPKDIKDTLSRFFPTVDRISLAKAIALGDKGAKELQNQVAGYEVLSAAEKQGLGANQIVGGTTAETAYQYALGGETYNTALTKFGTVAAMLPTVNKLTQVYGEETLGQRGVEEAVFGKSAKEIKTLEDLVKKEEATYSAKSGVSQISLASQRRAAGLI